MLRERPQFRARLDSLAAARQFFAEWFAETDQTRETLWVAHLDKDWNCLNLSRFDGSEANAPIPVRAIIVDAIRHSTAGLVLAHNHPSGDARPSASDRRATSFLATLAKGLNCVVLDHLIFARDDYTSFRKMGLL